VGISFGNIYDSNDDDDEGSKLFGILNGKKYY